MRRVSVVGTSGSGKSTLARELASILGVWHLELDSVYHQAGWTALPTEEFKQAIAVRSAEDGWVIDGNYSVVRPIVWARADTVLWLDLPRRTVMRQITWRTLRRVAVQEELWNGNRERWRSLFTWNPGKSIISWTWHKHAEYQARYSAAATDPVNAHLTFIRLASRDDITRFLAEARDQRASLPESHGPAALIRVMAGGHRPHLARSGSHSPHVRGSVGGHQD